VLLWTASVAYIFLLMCNFNSLRVSIRIIETAGDFFADTKRVALVPVFFFVLAVASFFAWVYGYVCVRSIGTITDINYQFQYRQVEYGPVVNNMLWAMIFGLFWIMAFLLTCNEFVVVVSAASWYFSDKDKPDDDGIPGDAEVMKGFTWILRYHFGSLALGSLTVAIVWVIRAVFEYVAHKIQDSVGNNGFTRALLASIRCCLGCFDKFLRYINRNAYIYMAISSESFCSSALNAFILMLKNAAKFAFVQTFSEVFMFIAKIAIAVGSTVASMLMMNYFLGANAVTSPIVPALLMFGIAYIVAGIFVSIFDASANTILQCYLIDKDITKQRGAHLEPTHVPPTLRKFLKTHDEEQCKDPLRANLIN
jgi:solute carrier family 44 (choline transporter-like protein), member 2/4/5